MLDSLVAAMGCYPTKRGEVGTGNQKTNVDCAPGFAGRSLSRLFFVVTRPNILLVVMLTGRFPVSWILLHHLGMMF
jgi:hypothetical protein